MITGGYNGGSLKSAEIFNPVTKTSCSLPQLPEARTHHSEDGGIACGGVEEASVKTCVKWSPASGTWTSHTLSDRGDMVMCPGPLPQECISLEVPPVR